MEERDGYVDNGLLLSEEESNFFKKEIDNHLFCINLDKNFGLVKNYYLYTTFFGCLMSFSCAFVWNAARLMHTYYININRNNFQKRAIGASKIFHLLDFKQFTHF